MDQQHSDAAAPRAANPATSSTPPSGESSPPVATTMLPTPPTPPHSPRFEGHHKAGSRASLDTFRSTQSRKEYMDSLVVPSKDEIVRIAEVQEEREAEHKRRSREQQRHSLEMAGREHPAGGGSPHRHREGLRKIFGFGHKDDEAVRAKAATVIQRTYRGYRTRREMNGLGIDAGTRWVTAIREAQYRELMRPRARAELSEGAQAPSVLEHPPDNGSVMSGSMAKANWKKAATIAKRAGFDQDSASDSSSESSSSSSSEDGHMPEERREARKRREEAKARRRKEARMMDLQYFLEMVDLKHRYGSNLRTYHEEWKKSNTNENFFYWLDYGEGRNIDIAACPRERLDRERVRYLSREERQYYLVQVDSEGRLCWAKNGVRIDTTEKWKDSIHGIVPADDPTPAYRPESDPGGTSVLADSSTEESSGMSESELEATRAARYAYATPSFDQAKGVKKITHVSASTIFNQLLRKSVKKNTWIFVADTSFRLYVGIKASGAFQHSSFMQGSRVSAAGLIKIKNGRLTSLSPLSGHYRPPASNFRAFVKSLKEEGVDMSHVSISKAYAVLVGLEAYMKTKQKAKQLVRKATHQKDKILAPEETRRQEEAERDKSESAQKERKLLEEQEKQREENKIGVQLMQKLNLNPREPDGQKGATDGAEQKAAAAAAT